MQSCGGSSFWSGTNWYYFKTNVICNLNVYLGRIPMPPKAQAVPAGTRGQGLRAQECQRRAQRPGRAPSSRVGYFAGGPAGPSRLRLHQGAHLHPIGRRKVKQMQPILVFLFIALFFFFFFFFVGSKRQRRHWPSTTSSARARRCPPSVQATTSAAPATTCTPIPPLPEPPQNKNKSSPVPCPPHSPLQCFTV